VNIVVKPGDTEAIVSWLDVQGAESYNVYFSTDPEMTIQSATKIEGVTSPYTQTGSPVRILKPANRFRNNSE